VRRLLFILALLLLADCGGETTGPQLSNDFGQPDQVVPPADTAGEVVLPPLDVQETTEDGFDIRFGDVDAGETDDVVEPPPTCDTGGWFGCPCDWNGDCESGWCVDYMGTTVCTQTCIEECPAGWSCKQVAGAETDVVFICIPDFSLLCRPCADHSDCQTVAGQEEFCVAYGPEEGSFCGGECSDDQPCPDGFSCTDAADKDGNGSLQCTADGACPCSDKSIALGLSTPCFIENELGTCTGHRMCTEEGLTDCDAPEPSEEVCDGVDNDCDGETDGDDLCDDGNVCSGDACQGADGCLHVGLYGIPCDDGDACTVGDTCYGADGGVCKGDDIPCDDEELCTDDWCDSETGCVFDYNSAPCDDEDPCTLGDHCNEGQCAGEPVACDCETDLDCIQLEDGDLCNGTLVCDTSSVPYVCKIDLETVVKCPEPEPEKAACNKAVCEPIFGECHVAPAADGIGCNDGDACTMGDACKFGNCLPQADLNCDDGNLCTDDGCEPLEGCTYTQNQAPCDDMNACTEGDKCSNGWCAGEPVVCDDTNMCTDDACAPDGGCVFTMNDLPCDDGNLCTTGDHCHLGGCISAGELNCNDGNICTDDGCDELAGCTHVPNQTACDDMNACTESDKCTNGWCLGTQLDCNDGNVCTDDGCDADAGCVHTANTAPCNDQDICTLNDQCQDSNCMGGAELVCDDGNLCTDDLCNPDNGCEFVFNQAPCDDGNGCTEGDKCTNGSCQSGLSCLEIGKVCIDDACQDNEPPSAPEVAIAPAGPVKHDDLVCQVLVESVDPEGDNVSYAFSWEKNGEAVPGLNSATAPAALTAECDTWVCKVVASDPFSSSDEAQAETEVLKTSHALYFDGNDDQVLIPGVDTNGLAAVTVEAWLRPDVMSTPDQDILVCDAGHKGFSLTLNESTWPYEAGMFNFYVGDGDKWNPVNSLAHIQDNTWYHVAGVWEGNSVRIYVNGVKEGETAAVMVPNVVTCAMGNDNSSPEFFKGLIAQVRISSTARYDADFQPQALFELDDDCLALWWINEGKGDLIYDASDSEYLGHLQGPAWQEGKAVTCSQCEPDCPVNCGPDGCGGLCGMCESCKSILDFGGAQGDGVYQLDPDGVGVGEPAYDAYCDMTTNGGGWTLVAKLTNSDDENWMWNKPIWNSNTLLNEADFDVTQDQDAKFRAWNDVVSEAILIREFVHWDMPLLETKPGCIQHKSFGTFMKGLCVWGNSHFKRTCDLEFQETAFDHPFHCASPGYESNTLRFVAADNTEHDRDVMTTTSNWDYNWGFGDKSDAQNGIETSDVGDCGENVGDSTYIAPGIYGIFVR